MYLGEPGRMVRIKCPTSLQVTPAGRHSFATTLGGTVKAQVGPKARRTWGVSLGPLSTPADVGVLMDFVNGSWGLGPWWFVPADAPVVNLLPPDAAACDPAAVSISDGGQLLGSPPLHLGDEGVAAQAIWKTDTGSAVLGAPVPALPNTPVTGSAWVIGAGTVRLQFVDATGATISGANTEQHGGLLPARLAVTATAPENVAGVQLMVVGPATQIARPAITWTDQPYPWGDGQGCPKAIVHSVSREVVKAWNNPTTGRWSDMTFTIQEVG